MHGISKQIVSVDGELPDMREWQQIVNNIR